MGTYAKDEVVVAQGEEHHSIFQIGVGDCRVEILTDEGATRVVGQMRQPEMFGEISFLNADGGSGASVSVVADDDEVVDIYIIDADYIAALFLKDAAQGAANSSAS